LADRGHLGDLLSTPIKFNWSLSYPVLLVLHGVRDFYILVKQSTRFCVKKPRIKIGIETPEIHAVKDES
jgi:hypothetical protein